jgi:cellulose synthase/poly-beta-1,6-N-acetylglucosamine synthase-like glycosyltransferase
MFVLEILLSILALLASLPIIILTAECYSAMLPARDPKIDEAIDRPTIAVLIPAHNEALEIGTTLEILKLDLHPEDRLIVIADNCTDDTASIARSVGATVLERTDLQRRGKGYTLDYGLQYLATEPPAAVIVIDADTHVHPGTIDRLARLAISHHRPIQATYLLSATGRAKSQITAFGFTLKNLIRSRGAARWEMACFLHGTGMAFPWALIDRAVFASGNIVEDMQLGLDLSIAGYPPLFCGNAKVTGALPQQERAAKTQKTRWEHGHLQTLITQFPRLVIAALRQRRLDLLVMALDLCVPPLSLLVALWLVAVGLASAIALFSTSGYLPLAILATSGAMLISSILLAWGKFCRRDLPLGTLLRVPMYVLWKLPIYLRFLLRPQTEWVRTERDR